MKMIAADAADDDDDVQGWRPALTLGVPGKITLS